MTILFLFFGLGIVTFLMRFSFIGLLGKKELPQAFRVALYFVPLTVLTAIIVPDVFMHGENNSLYLLDPRVPAALVAIFVAARTKQVLPTLIAGMGVLWLLRWLIG